MIPYEFAWPGQSPSTYAFVKSDTRRNLYRIPLPYPLMIVPDDDELLTLRVPTTLVDAFDVAADSRSMTRADYWMEQPRRDRLLIPSLSADPFEEVRLIHRRA